AAELRGRDDERQVLDGARLQERMPVVAAGVQRERRRHREDARALAGERAVELGEAQVVADGEADLGRAGVDDDRLFAGLDRGRLAVGGAVGDGDVEEVDLAVDAANFAAGIDVDRGVVYVRGRD